jgi:hypothetical protein
MRLPVVLPLLLACLPLGGCVAGMAASAVGMAARAAQGTPQSNAQLRPGAVEACSAQAAAYGAVHIIDVEQRSVDRLIVWGTAGEGQQRRSFECHFTTRVVAFKLRQIAR